VKSFARPSFWRAYHGLDSAVRKDAKHAYKLFESSPDHPSLRFKKLSGTKDIWSVRISAKYRALGRRNGEEIHWFWVGSHNDFDNLF
jgi:uncharacterized membrane protein